MSYESNLKKEILKEIKNLLKEESSLIQLSSGPQKRQEIITYMYSIGEAEHMHTTRGAKPGGALGDAPSSAAGRIEKGLSTDIITNIDMDRKNAMWDINYLDLTTQTYFRGMDGKRLLEFVTWANDPNIQTEIQQRKLGSGGQLNDLLKAFEKICSVKTVAAQDGKMYHVPCRPAPGTTSGIPCGIVKEIGPSVAGGTMVPALTINTAGGYLIAQNLCGERSITPTPPKPEPPVPPTPPKPEPSPTPSPDQDEMSACRIAFVGKNGGQESGPLVAKVQKYLEAYSFLAKGSYTPGKLEASTDKAIKNLQRKMNEYGKKISSGVGGDYGTAKGPGMKAGDVGAALTLNPDGCYGPKTSCAATLFYGLPDIYGRSKARCAAKLKLSKEQAAAAESVVQGQISPETFVSRGIEAGKKFFGGDTEGAKQALGKTAQQTAKEKAKELGIKESKNWLDKTREETTSNLFERLVKDAASKKVI